MLCDRNQTQSFRGEQHRLQSVEGETNVKGNELAHTDIHIVAVSVLAQYIFNICGAH